MSKDKGNKDKKKTSATETKKAPSDYQSGKTTVSKSEIVPLTKKKK